MLELLRLQNFKSARELDVPLNRLTVLSGLNGAGKSTVLQAIALLRQSLQLSNESRLTNFQLRGPLVQLGVAGDVLSQRAGENKIGITVFRDGSSQSWVANAPTEPEDATPWLTHSDILELQSDPAPRHAVETYLSDCHFQFLQADRLTPKTHYDRSDAANRKLGFLGPHGQYTPDFLAEHGGILDVNTARQSPKTGLNLPQELIERIGVTPKLYSQISGWLQHLSPGVNLNAELISQTDLVTLGFSYLSPEIAQDSTRRRPSNVGFGLTYCLPIITACLSAPTGALLLLENPEAHLHPQGQAALGALLAKCASDGVQIIVETHSDHVLNGIRIAARKGLIKGQDIQLCHFTRNIANGDSQVETPSVLPNGELSAWPDGFFDEWEKSLEALLG